MENFYGRVMKGFYTKRLLILIMFVLVLLSVCISIDYADNNTIENTKDANDIIGASKLEVYDNESVVGVNGSDSSFTVKSTDKIYKVKEKTREKSKLPLVTITARPSVRSGYAYRWYTTTFINYCPHCHKYGTLRNVHKYPARFEQELTCDTRLGGCDCDYCGVTGKEKYSWSNYYLTRA